MCGGTTQTISYKHNIQEIKIAVKDLDVINKWTKGAIARRRLIKMILTKQIQSKL